MNIGKQITGNDLGYDVERWEPSTPGVAPGVDEWLSRLNDEAAHDDDALGDTARALLKAVASKVALRRV